MSEDGSGVVSLVGNDVFNDPLTYSVGYPENGKLLVERRYIVAEVSVSEELVELPNATYPTSVILNHPSFFYVPDQHYNGTDEFSYAASDGSKISNSATVDVRIAAVPDAAEAVIASPLPIDPDTFVRITDPSVTVELDVVDPDNEGGDATVTIVSWSLVSGPVSAISFAPQMIEGKIVTRQSFEVSFPMNGRYVIAVSVEDGQDTTTTELEIDVNDPNYFTVFGDVRDGVEYVALFEEYSLVGSNRRCEIDI